MERYIIDIEYNPPGEHPVSVYLRKVNIDSKGYQIGEYHGKTLAAQLSKVKTEIMEQETVTVTVD